MGGTHEHLPTIPLDRACHQALHDGLFELRVHEGIAQTVEGGCVVSERALVVHDDFADDDEYERYSRDPRYWSDERLCQVWRGAEANGLDAFFQVCEVAYTFWQRYRWEPMWYERAAEILSDGLGYSINWRRVYERAHVWDTFKDRREDYQYLGPRVAIVVAEDAEPEEALAIATVATDSYHSREETVKIVRARDSARAATPPPRHECPECHALHRVKGA